jgi:hypothetical protein
LGNGDETKDGGGQRRDGVRCALAAIMLLVTVVLVIGIRESATTDAVLMLVKVGVVLFVIGAGIDYVNRANGNAVPPAEQLTPEQILITDKGGSEVRTHEKLTKEGCIKQLRTQAEATYSVGRSRTLPPGPQGSKQAEHPVPEDQAQARPRHAPSGPACSGGSSPSRLVPSDSGLAPGAGAGPGSQGGGDCLRPL